MKTVNSIRIAGLIAIILLLTGCQPKTMTVTFTETTCTYAGPISIPYGKFNLNWVIKDETHPAFSLAFLTLQEGKTIDDLRRGTSANLPGYATVLWGEEKTGSGSFTYENDLKNEADYHGEPLYVVCFNKDADGESRKIGAIGPIKVK